ncbi:SnoaL-like domain protein [compost metagenome]
MPDRQALIDVVEAAYAAFVSRHPQKLLQFCAPHCRWQAPGVQAFMPWAGEHHGHAGVLGFVGELNQHLEFLTVTTSSLVVDVEQNQVVALGVARCRVKATGQTYVNHWAHLFTLRDGLIVAFQEYPDTAAQLSAIHPALLATNTPEERIHD